MNKRGLSIEVAKGFLNLPYRWGGNDPLAGFDCSGLIVEILQSVGIMARGLDYTANGLSKLYAESDLMEPGNLVYWDWNGDGIYDHIEMIAFIDDTGEVFTIGASGGGSATTSEESAISQDAFVKIRPLRDGWKFISDPFAG